MGPGIPIGKYIPISVMVDDIKVSGQYILASSITTWIEVQMVEPYQGSWFVRPCFHHRSPNWMILQCKGWAAVLKLELEYRKMKAIDDHYQINPLWPPASPCGYPEI